MTDPTNKGEQASKAVSLNVRLTPIRESEPPTFANYTTVGMTQGIAYLDFGFLEPALLAAVAQRAQKGEAVPKQLEGKLAVRVALPLDAMLRLQQQLGQVSAGLRGRKEAKP
jgi:uncharacterized membrane protein